MGKYLKFILIPAKTIPNTVSLKYALAYWMKLSVNILSNTITQSAGQNYIKVCLPKLFFQILFQTYIQHEKAQQNGQMYI